MELLLRDRDQQNETFDDLSRDSAASGVPNSAIEPAQVRLGVPSGLHRLSAPRRLFAADVQEDDTIDGTPLRCTLGYLPPQVEPCAAIEHSVTPPLRCAFEALDWPPQFLSRSFT